MNLYDDLYDRYGHYSDEIFRAARLVVDTGKHSLHNYILAVLSNTRLTVGFFKHAQNLLDFHVLDVNIDKEYSTSVNFVHVLVTKTTMFIFKKTTSPPSAEYESM